ncbi:hypothetical protein DFP93_112100 [Aneurinibacillus soli]|uniref:Uncharacterized protein n=1 Tax=Aneurinibacillus soli TaxID=1500254 RepID=A0A0U4WNK1_9BACL|nr:hypothetical protein [Aneurinibacillus soli]PYE60660.1 hypothetical protein DFP93_112100 [Aneurinibacillus soli]BAU29816.1 hypothetical protein CB4_04070 [Aneurinibacillus soli]
MEKQFLGLAFISSISLLLLAILQWELVDFFTPFFMPVIWLCAVIFFLVVAIASISIAVKEKVWKPLLVQGVALSLYLFVPFTSIMISLDFYLYKSARQEVIRMVESQELRPTVSETSSLIHLPPKYERLSKGGGDIMVKKQGDKYALFFFTFRGMLDNFSGFMYVPSEQFPTDAFGGGFAEIQEIEKHWYWIGSH